MKEIAIALSSALVEELGYFPSDHADYHIGGKVRFLLLRGNE